MFGFSKKTAKPASVDKVWQTSHACLTGVAELAIAVMQASGTLLVFTFFERSKDHLVSFLRDRHIEFLTVGPGQVPAEVGRGKVVLVADAFLLADADWSKRVLSIAGVVPIFYGRYPLNAPEDALLAAFGQQPGLPIPVFCISLEDELMRQFGSERIKQVMTAMGLKENEAIEHDMVSQAIRSARNKLDKKVTSEMRAKSESEWFSKNVIPEL